jgi:hypothetical protein
VSTDVSALFTALSNFGAFGILVAFLIWKDIRADNARLKAEQEHLAEKKLQDERRLAYDRERLEADKALAASLAALTSAIQSRSGAK